MTTAASNHCCSLVKEPHI